MATPKDETFASLFEQSTDARAGKRRFHVGESLEVTIVVIGKDSVFADLGAKQEGFFERPDLVDESGKLRVELGSRVTAVVKGVDQNGQVHLGPVVVKNAEGDVEATLPSAAAAGPVLVEGARVRGKITGIERYGLFVQIAGTQGRNGRGLVPVSETGTPRNSDLKKLFTVGDEVETKILAIEPESGKIRLSIAALAADADRATYEAFRAGATDEAPAKGGEKKPQARGFGTFGDLLSKKPKR